MTSIAEYDKIMTKKMVNISIKEIPNSAMDTPIEFEWLQPDEKKELCLITSEMAYVLCYHIIQELPDIEKTIIRYQFGLPKQYDRGKYYPVMNRQQLAKKLKNNRYFKERGLNDIFQISKEIKHLREKGLKTMFRLIMRER